MQITYYAYIIRNYFHNDDNDMNFNFTFEDLERFIHAFDVPIDNMVGVYFQMYLDKPTGYEDEYLDDVENKDIINAILKSCKIFRKNRRYWNKLIPLFNRIVDIRNDLNRLNRLIPLLNRIIDHRHVRIP